MESGHNVLLCRLVGNPCTAKFRSVPIHVYAGGFALLIPNKCELYIILSRDGVHEEMGFARWKEFGSVITWHAADRSDEMVSQFIRLLSDTESWAEVDQPEKE